jgi:hypothetical protein
MQRPAGPSAAPFPSRHPAAAAKPRFFCCPLSAGHTQISPRSNTRPRCETHGREYSTPRQCPRSPIQPAKPPASLTLTAASLSECRAGTAAGQELQSAASNRPFAVELMNLGRLTGIRERRGMQSATADCARPTNTSPTGRPLSAANLNSSIATTEHAYSNGVPETRSATSCRSTAARIAARKWGDPTLATRKYTGGSSKTQRCGANSVT